MSYTPFSDDGLTPQTLAVSVPIIAQANDNALADDLALWGALGWSGQVEYDTQGRVTKQTSVRGNRGTRVDYTYVASGPSAGEVQDETYYESVDTGATWVLRSDTHAAAGKCTYTYNASGDLISEDWS